MLAWGLFMKALGDVVLLTAALMLSSTAAADVLSLKAENDIFSGGKDGHYTNGLEGVLTFEPEADHWTRDMASLIPGWTSQDLGYAAYRFGHQIYTPEDIEQTDLQKDDRPYAGLLYGGLTLMSIEQLASHRETSTFSLDIGLVGQGAGGEKIQREVHKITGSDSPEGWDNQLTNEPFVNLGYEKRWWLQSQLGGLEMEYGPSVGGALGNLYAYLSTGGGVRLGQGLSRSISQASPTPDLGDVQFFNPDGGFGWFVYANLEGRYVAHNMLLDGNTFHDSHSVDREDLVGDAQLGLTLMWDRWQLSAANIWRTREFKGQNEPDQFGLLSLSTWL